MQASAKFTMGRQRRMASRHEPEANTSPRAVGPAAVLASALLALAGCQQQSAAPSGTPGAPPPPAVGVVTVSPGWVGLENELPGRIEAIRTAQVRARTPGIVLRQLFREGSDVKAGQALFQIDDAPYRVALATAQASLARAEANLTQTRAQAERYKPLAEANAVSQQDLVTAVAAQKLAEADVAAAKAAVQGAQINLDYAAVTSPIAGRIGRALVTEGALVGQGESTPLALVQQTDPVLVSFTQPVADVLRLRAAVAAGRFKGTPGSAPVRLVLDDGSVYPMAGKLLFTDLSVDPGTGQITLRAEVPNPKGILLPGMFVRGRIEQAQVDAAILLPQQAVARGPQGDTVKVVASDGALSTREVKLGGAQGSAWVVLSGLTAGEQVMVEGFQKIGGKSVVKPVPWPAALSAAGSGAAGAAPAASAASVSASVGASASASSGAASAASKS